MQAVEREDASGCYGSSIRVEEENGVRARG